MWLPCLLLLFTAGEDQPPADVQIALTKVHRIYVDILTGGESALRIRDLLMTSLQNSKLFVITEDIERADAVLKGAAEDTPFTDIFQSSDGINARSQLSLPGSNGSGSRSSTRSAAGLTIGENESRKTEERKHEAMVTVRLVGKDGDVIWSTTQESLGGKFMGAAADVADKVSKRLAADYRRAQVPAGVKP